MPRRKQEGEGTSNVKTKLYMDICYTQSVCARMCVHVHACADSQRAGKPRLRNVPVGFHTGKAHLRMTAAQREVRKAERSRETIAADITEHPVVLIKSEYYTLCASQTEGAQPRLCAGKMQNESTQHSF